MTDTSPVPPGGPRSWLIVGLGNPGRDYERSRHNAGARAVASLAGRLGTHLRRSKFRALVGEARTDGVPLKLAFPTTFMNDSGQAVAPLEVPRRGPGLRARESVQWPSVVAALEKRELQRGDPRRGRAGRRSRRE